MPSARVRRRSFLPHWALLFLTAVLAGVAGLFGAGSAWAMTVSASAAAVVTAEPETAPHPASTVTSSTYDTVAYDAPAQLSSLNAAAAGARGSSAAPGVTSWQRSVSARGFGVAANTASRAGWSVGGDIYSATRAGNSPSWSAVRARFWKNESASPQYGTWTDDQLARMSTGRAPQRFNPDKGGIESMDLSHEPIPFRDGGTDIVPRWPQDRAAIDPFRYPGY